jgi:hypothetical protein
MFWMKEKAMQIPAEVKPACWGAVGGAVALAIVGFMWGGWVTGGKAEARANERAAAEVVKVLAPICADRFMHHANVSKNLNDLNKIDSWRRESFVEKGGWATLPGSDSAPSGVARACAEILGKQKV